MEGEANAGAPVGAPEKKSKTGLIIGVVIVIIVLAIGGYFLMSKKSGGSSGGIFSAITSGGLNPNCKYNDPDLCKFVNGWKDVKYFTATSTSSLNGKSDTTTFKMDGKTKSQFVSTENGKENSNMIVIDKTTYTKDYADNKWFKFTPKPTDPNIIKEEESNNDFNTKADSTEDKTTYKKIGTEACGKLTCFKYQVIDPANTDSIEYIYFDNKEYQLRKTRDELKDGTVAESTYDYSKVSISEPSPIKEGNPYDTSAASSAAAAAAAAAATSQTTAPAVTTPSTATPTDSTTTDTTSDTPVDTTNFGQ